MTRLGRSWLCVCLSTSILGCWKNPLYRYSHTIAADVNVDGVGDVVYLEKTWNFEEGYRYPIVIRMGTKENGLTEPRFVATIVDQAGGPTDMKLEDLDGDGLPDLTFQLGPEPSRRFWMRNNGKESFEDFRAVSDEPAGLPFRVAASGVASGDWSTGASATGEPVVCGTRRSARPTGLI